MSHSRRWLAVAVALSGCARTGLPRAIPISRPDPVMELGALPTGDSFTIDAGVSDVRLVLEARDSVVWAFEAKPPSCATADATPGRLGLARHREHCSIRWDVHMPLIADVRVNVSVGDVDVIAPLDRALRLRANVGSVRLRIDNRELHHSSSPGSGDQLELGDLSSVPRLDVRTGVGSVKADLYADASLRPPVLRKQVHFR
jgi:hypothetical protein